MTDTSGSLIALTRHLLCITFWCITLPFRLPIAAGVTLVVMFAGVKTWACTGYNDWGEDVNWLCEEMLINVLVRGRLLP